MGQILHGSGVTTYAVRAAVQRSKATAKELAGRHGLNSKTVGGGRSATSSRTRRWDLRPVPVDQNPWAQSRKPMDMILQG
jgi:hypothetical protein